MESTPAEVDESSTPLQDMEYHRALDRAKFLKQPKYVFSRILEGPKQSLTGLRYFIGWYGYRLNADSGKSVNHIPCSHTLLTVNERTLKSQKSFIVA